MQLGSSTPFFEGCTCQRALQRAASSSFSALSLTFSNRVFAWQASAEYFFSKVTASWKNLRNIGRPLCCLYLNARVWWTGLLYWIGCHGWKFLLLLGKGAMHSSALRRIPARSHRRSWLGYFEVSWRLRCFQSSWFPGILIVLWSFWEVCRIRNLGGFSSTGLEV